MRIFVSERAARAGFGREQISDLVPAVNELATNSMRHGGGRGLWLVNHLCDLVQVRSRRPGT